MRTPTFIVIFSTALALMLVGMFASLLFAVGNISEYLRSRVRIHVYMERELGATQLADAKDSMALALSAIQSSNLFTYKLVSKEQAAEDFRKSAGEDFITFLGTNPLRDYYEISILGDANTPENLAQAKNLLSKVPGVFEVTYLQSLAQTLAKNIRTGAFILGGLALMLCLAAGALVSNTVSLQLFGKRFLVRSMQLVGARPWFVLRPFLRQAAVLSGLGGLFASFSLFLMYLLLTRSAPDAQDFLPMRTLAIVCGSVILAGLVLGVTTSYFTIKRYLRLPLDKLI
jgi:cell division transport system permease protein